MRQLRKKLVVDKLEICRARRQILAGESAAVEERIRRVIETAKGNEKYLKRLAVRYSRGLTIVATADIEWIGAAGHYVEVHIGKTTHLIREQITNLAGRLDPDRFARIHRSTIVNIEQVSAMRPLFNGDQMVMLKNGKELNMSRTYTDNLKSRLTY